MQSMQSFCVSCMLDMPYFRHLLLWEAGHCLQSDFVFMFMYAVVSRTPAFGKV